MKPLTRLLLVAAALCIAFPAQAQRYPERPVRVVVPFSAGGTTDIVARYLASGLAAGLARPFVVENKPGAGSNIGAEFVAKSAPDGYTLLVASISMAANIALYGKLNYSPERDLLPVTVAVEIPIVLLVPPSLPAKSVAELIAMAKAQPGRLNYGSAGLGTVGHLSAEMFRSIVGVDIVHLPYKGGAPVLTDLVSGTLQLGFSDLAGPLPYVMDGRLRALAITSDRRVASLPQVPTMGEAGLPGFKASSWIALFAPAGTPQAIVDRLNAEAAKLLLAPEMHERMTKLGFIVVGNNPAEAAAFMRTEVTKWTKVVRDSGAKLD